LSAIAQSKTFLRDNYIKKIPFGTGRWMDPKGERREYDTDAYRLAVEGFLTSLGPGRVISVNVLDPTMHVLGRVVVWYWEEA